MSREAAFPHLRIPPLLANLILFLALGKETRQVLTVENISLDNSPFLVYCLTAGKRKLAPQQGPFALAIPTVTALGTATLLLMGTLAN